MQLTLSSSTTVYQKVQHVVLRYVEKASPKQSAGVPLMQAKKKKKIYSHLRVKRNREENGRPFPRASSLIPGQGTGGERILGNLGTDQGRFSPQGRVGQFQKNNSAQQKRP